MQEPTPDERAAFLEGACRGYPALRAQLDALLEAHFGAAGFLPGSPASGPLPVAARSVPAEEGQARMIGRYKLLEQIGEGGMGDSLDGRTTGAGPPPGRAEDHQAGHGHRQVVARFEAERQALAMMDHPNIAKVFDAGTTENGRPYFVMELVQGVTITEYCDQNELPTRDRLKLFIQVCQAIQHAHQKGIIHRDIKPSNILVDSP